MAAESTLSATTALPWELALRITKDALKSEGFGVITEIDVQSTVKEELGAEFRRYQILGACNPSIAYAGLQKRLDVGLLLPCNVIVYEKDGRSVVAIQDPTELLALAREPGLDALARIARSHLERVIDALRAKAAA